jgi:large subunit ribosomal protein L44e
VKIPKNINIYCPRCKAHTTHTVTLYRKGKDRSLSAGARHHEREKHGYGGQKFPELKKTAKTTKKVVLNLKCKNCNYTLQRMGIRLRKAEIKS